MPERLKRPTRQSDRSTTQRFGKTTNPHFDLCDRFGRSCGIVQRFSRAVARTSDDFDMNVA